MIPLVAVGAVAASGGGEALNAPTIAIEDGVGETNTADEGDELTVLVTVDDGDGSTTTDVELYLNGVLVDSMTDDGGGDWSYALTDVLPGSHTYRAKRITAEGNADSATWLVTVAAEAPALDAPADAAVVTIGDPLTFEATGTADGFDANTSKVEFYVASVLRATALTDTAGIWTDDWDTTGAAEASGQAVVARRYWAGVSGQTGTVDSVDDVEIEIEEDVGGAPTNVPTVSIQHSAADVAFAPDIVALTARAVVNDGDGFTTTGVEFFRGATSLGAGVDQGSGVWTLALAKQTQPASATAYNYTARRITASGNVDSVAYVCEIANLLTIFGTLGGYWRTTNLTLAGSTITAAADLSGNSRHLDFSAEPSTYTASDSGFNNQPSGKYTSTTNSNRGVTPSWTRAAPGTTKRLRIGVVRSESTSAANRVLFGDTTASTFLVIQTNTSNSLQMLNGGTGNSNANAAIGDNVKVEAYYSNLSTTDYLRVGDTTIVGNSAGNNSGSASRVGGSSSGSRWQGAWTEFAEYEGTPSLAQLSKTDAYCSMAYGVEV